MMLTVKEHMVNVHTEKVMLECLSSEYTCMNVRMWLANVFDVCMDQDTHTTRVHGTNSHSYAMIHEGNVSYSRVGSNILITNMNVRTYATMYTNGIK